MALISSLIIGGIFLAVTSAAVSYKATDGWGMGNATESSDQARQKAEQEYKAQEQKQILKDMTILERGDKLYAKYRLKGLPSINQINLPSVRKITPPAIKPIMSPTAPNKLWAEVNLPETNYKAPNGTRANAFTNRNDSREINSISDVGSSIIDSIFTGKFTGKQEKYSPFWGGGIQHWWDFLNPLKLAEAVYNATATSIDTALWDIDGDGQDSWLKNLFVDPWIAHAEGNASFGQSVTAAIFNPLIALGEDLDILSLANVVKGIANNGYEGALSSLGFQNSFMSKSFWTKEDDKEWQRQNYDWNIKTGSGVGDFFANLGAELLSDPLMVAQLGGWALGKAGLKGANKTAQEFIEASVKRSSKIIKAQVGKVASELGPEATDIALRQFGKKVAPGIVEASANRSTKELVKHTSKIITDNIDEVLERTSKTLTKKIAKEGISNVDEIAEIALKEIRTSITGILAKNGINPSTISAQRIIGRVSKTLVKNIPYDTLTKQILSTFSVQAFKAGKMVSKFDNLATKWAFRINFPHLKLGGLTITALSKVPVVGTLPAKFFKDVKGALARGTNGIIESVLAPITNKRAWKVAKEVQQQFGKNILDETVYKTTREIFQTSTKIFDDISSEAVKVNSKKVIRANAMSVQTTATAFTRQQYLRFSKDAAVYEYIVKKNKENIPAITGAWNIYVKKNYPGIKDGEHYLKQLRKVSAIESGAFDTVANRIALQDAYIKYSTAHNMVKPGDSKLYRAAQEQPHLNAKDFKTLAEAENLQTVTDAKDLKIKIQDVQYGRFKRNNYLEQADMLDAWDKVISDAEYNPSTSILEQLINDADPDIAEVASNLKRKFERARKQQTFLNNMSASGLSIGEPPIDEYLHIALTDTFLGLKGGNVGIDDIDELLDVWLDKAQIAVRNYAGVNYTPNLKTNDTIISLKAQLMVYADQLGTGVPMVNLLRESMSEMSGLHKKLTDIAQSTGDKAYVKAFNEIDAALTKSKESIMKLSDDLVIIPNRAYNNLGEAAVNNIPGHLQKAANGAFAYTLTPIINLHNVAQFFSRVNGSLTFDFHTVTTIQTIADRATSVFNKLDSGIDELITPVTKEAIDKTYDEFLRILQNKSNIYDSKGLYIILSSAAEETTARKYALLRSIVLEKNNGNVALFDLKKVLDELLDVPAYKEARVALDNIKYYSKQQITINTGISAYKYSKISVQDNIKVALNELNGLNNINITTKNSNASLQKRLELQSNASPLLATYTKQLNAVQETFEQIVTPYQNVVKMSILQERINNNLHIMEQAVKNGHFSQEDARTLANIYDGVENTPEALSVLQRRVDDYNRSVIDLSHIDRDGKSIRDQIKDIKGPLSEKASVKNFLNIWTKETWNNQDMEAYKMYMQIIKGKNLPVPNAIKKVLAEEIDNLGLFRIRLDSTTTSLGYANKYSSVFLTANTKTYDELLYTARHELLHSALSRMPAGERSDVINKTFNHLYAGEHSKFIEEYYIAAYSLYYQRGSMGEAYSSLRGVPFNFSDEAIREEVLADLVNILSEEGLEGLNKRKNLLVKKAREELKQYKAGIISRKEMPVNMEQYIRQLTDTTLLPDKELEGLVNIYYLGNIKAMAERSPDATALIPPNSVGAKLYVGSPFEYTEQLIRKYKRAEVSRTRSIIRHRLGMSAEEMAEDLARSGPFAFYSMSALQDMKDNSGAWKWFDYDFKLRPHTREALEKAGITLEIIPEMDSVVFILKKDRVAYMNNMSLLNGRPVKAVQDFAYNDIKYTTVVDGSPQEFTTSFKAYQDTMHSLRGQSMGYSRGFKVSNDYYTKLFKGVGQDAHDASFAVWQGIEALGKDWGNWTLDDLIVPKHYTTYRFEEMIMGDSTYARRFGVFVSDNPVINAANAVQQFSQVNKARTELSMNLFDETFSISKGIYKEYSDETLYKMLREHPEYRLMVQVPKKDGVGVTEIIPYNVEQIARAREAGAVLVPDSWYKRTYNTLNHRIGSEGALKAWQSILYVWKALALMNPMTFIRNWIDTDLKTAIEMREDFFKYQFRSKTLLSEYNSILYELGDNIYSDKTIREFFDSGASKVMAKTKYMDYELFQQIRRFDIWGPSGGLVKYMEPTTDQLSRQLAAEAMKEYKTWWESVTDFNSKVFDFASTTIGFNAERRDRLAMFLKALDDGKSIEQGFHWVSKTHFDYAFRSKSDQVLEMLFPFITFTQRNLEYFLKIYEEQPHLLRYFVEYQDTAWNVQDYTPEQILASQAIQRQLLNGSIPLFNGENGKDYYFKINPSFMDAFNTFVNPIGVLKDRVFLPMTAIQKAMTTNYKGENQFKSLSTSQQIFEAGKQIPGMGLVSQIYNSIGTDTPYPLNTAVGAYKRPPVTGYSYGGRYLEVVQWIPKGYNSYYNKNILKTKSYKQQQYVWNKYNFNTKYLSNYKNARISPLGNRVLDPYQASGQKLIKSLYLRSKVVNRVKYNTNVTKKVKKNYSINNYAINRAAFARY